ncbi:hypothetical protein GYH30_039383 [Glycine max]|nr:hypothetical protein GYH30_039383 [Glycine max]
MQSLKGGGRVHVGDVVCGGIMMVERDCVCGALKVEVTRVHELCAIVMVGTVHGGDGIRWWRNAEVASSDDGCVTMMWGRWSCDSRFG